MKSDSITVQNGDGDVYQRVQRGRFGQGNKGGPGRRRGPLPATIKLEQIKQAIVQSWTEVNGQKLLRNLAETDPGLYLKLVVGLLPKETRVEHSEVRQIVFNVAPISADRLPRRSVGLLNHENQLPERNVLPLPEN